MPVKIRIANLNKKKRVPQKDVKKAALRVLKNFKKKNVFLGITFVDNEKIRVLNKKYMKCDRFTDVISFTFNEKTPSNIKTIIGDVYISSDMAGVNAKRFDTNLKKELILYTIHGVLHVLGFGDKSVREKTKIRKLEEKFLKDLCPEN